MTTIGKTESDSLAIADTEQFAGPNTDAPEIAATSDLQRMVTAAGEVYEVEAVLGKGGLGVVYKARRADGSVVALKLARQRDRKHQELLESEGKIHGQLSSPHIVRILGLGYTADGQPYIALEYLDGSTLDKILQREGALSLSRALNICRQIAEAIQQAHDAGYLHRDLKPANIMITQQDGDDWVHVLDFGIAEPVEQPDGQTKQTSSGSLCYLSPEVVLNRKLSKRSDIYQLGLILHECLCGRLPFALSIAEAILYRLTGPVLEPDFAARLSGPVREILESALSRHEDGRPASMDLLCRRLAQAA